MAPTAGRAEAAATAAMTLTGAGWSIAAADEERDEEAELVNYVGELLMRVRDRVFKTRMRSRDPFRDFDKLHSGRCTAAQFARAVRNLEPELNPEEVDVLAEHFTDYGPKVGTQVVNYIKFCEAVDEVFGPSHLEGCPTASVPPPGRLLTATATAQAALAAAAFQDAEDVHFEPPPPGIFIPKPVHDTQKVLDVLRRVAMLEDTRGEQLLRRLMTGGNGIFMSHSGKLSREKFMSRFPWPNEFTKEEFDLIFDRYLTERDGVHAGAFFRDVAAAREHWKKWKEDLMEEKRPKSATTAASAFHASAAPVAAAAAAPRPLLQRSGRPSSAASLRITRSASDAPFGSLALTATAAPASSVQRTQAPVPGLKLLQRPSSAVSLRSSSNGSGWGLGDTNRSARSGGFGGFTRKSGAFAFSPGESRGSSARKEEPAEVAADPPKEFAPNFAASSGPPSARSDGSDEADILRDAQLPCRRELAFKQEAPPPAVASKPPEAAKQRPKSAFVSHRRRVEAMLPKMDVLAKVRTLVRQRRLRMSSNFREVDRFRRGTCTQSQMSAVLSLLGIALDLEGLTSLFNLYRSDEGLFKYPAFVADVEGGLAVSGSATGLVVSGSATGLTAAPGGAAGDEKSGLVTSGMCQEFVAVMSIEDLKEVEAFKMKIASVVRMRRMEEDVRDLFWEFGKHSPETLPGHMSRAAIGRTVSAMKLEFPERQLDLVSQAYCDFNDRGSVNYIALLDDIESLWTAMAERSAAGSRPGTALAGGRPALLSGGSCARVYFDNRGRVVPKRARPTSAPCGFRLRGR